jgi:hypothetical protein
MEGSIYLIYLVDTSHAAFLFEFDVGLFCNLLPDKVYSFKTEKYVEGRLGDRITGTSSQCGQQEAIVSHSRI